MFAILCNPFWAIDFKYYSIAEAVIKNRIASGQLALDDEKLRPKKYVEVDEEGKPTMWAAIGTGNASTKDSLNIAIIPVQGSLSKNGDWCTYGMKDIISMIDMVNKDPNYSAMVLHVDSPGGTVDGTEALATAVRDSKKPIVAFIDGLGASAAYWISSQAKFIYMNAETTSWAGSIGVVLTHVDQSEFLKAEGIKVTFLTDDESLYKVKGNSYEPLDSETIEMFVDDLNNIKKTFKGAVKSGRKDKLSTSENIFTAKVYNGRDAVKHGLADKIGTLQEAIDKAAQLARKQNDSSGSNASYQYEEKEGLWKITDNANSNQNTDISMFDKLKALLGMSSDEELTKESLQKAEEQLTSMEAKLSEMTTAKEALEADYKALQEANTSLQAKLDGLVTEKAGFETKVKEIEGNFEAFKKSQNDLTGKKEDESNKREASNKEKPSYQKKAEEAYDKVQKFGKK
jgi:protease-4